MSDEKPTRQITDLYKRRDDLKRDLAAVETAIERCHCDWEWTPPTAFEDRAGAWASVSYRTCVRCGIVQERITEKPRGPLGEWQRTAKFRKPAVLTAELVHSETAKITAPPRLEGDRRDA